LRILFVVNPAAGGGRASKAARFIGAALKSVRGIDADIALTREAGHAEALAKEGVKLGVSRVVAVGGDGTPHETVNGLLAGKSGPGAPLPSVGLVPCGTGNDFARGMGLFARAGVALQRCLGPADMPIDVGIINGRAFLNVAGFGFDAKVAAVVAEQNCGRGTIPYLLTALRLLPRYRPARLRLSVDGEALVATVLLGAVGNASTYGGGMKICPMAHAADGLLDLCLVGDIPPLDALANFARVYRGSHLSHPKCTYARALRIQVESDTDVPLHADGQLLGSLPATFSILPQAVRLAIGDVHAGSDGSTPKRANRSASFAQ